MAKNYDFKQVATIVGGVQIQGFADGTGVAVERDEDDVTMTVGNDGEGTFSEQNNKAGKVTITLMKSSASNAYLSGLMLAKSVVPVLVKDNSGADLHLGEQCRIQKPPAVEYARDVQSVEWVFITDNLQMFLGGNS